MTALAVLDAPTGAKYWMDEVPVGRLKIDPDYQRRHESPRSRARIKAMAESWDERIAEAITVAVRDDGWYVVNGGHRFLAARLAGVKTIKAVVWEGLSRQDEAWLYGEINTRTVRPTVHDLFRAKLARDDDAAVAISRIASGADVRLDLANSGSNAKRPDVTRAIGALEIVYAVGGPVVLDQTLRTLREAWPFDSKALTAHPIFGVAGFIVTYRGHPQFEFARIARKLAERPAIAMIQRSKVLALSGASGGRTHGSAVLHRSGPRRAVLEAYNQRLHNPLPDATLSDLRSLGLGRNPWADA